MEERRRRDYEATYRAQRRAVNDPELVALLPDWIAELRRKYDSPSA